MPTEGVIVSELWQGILLGALLSIPIGLAVNVASVGISRRIDKQTEQAASRRADRDSAFRERATRLARDRSALYVDLLEVLLRVAFMTALFGVLSGAAFLLGQVLPNIGLISTLLIVIGQSLALVGTLIVLNIVRPAIVLLREIRSIRELD